ncbi:MAG: hypothetical protein IIC74_07740 [Bacteroidetes bacterium]|nr:hypothetical protein [Bacteroidota bacterium]
MLWVEKQNDDRISGELSDLDGIDFQPNSWIFSGLKKNLMHQLHSLSRIMEMIRLANLESAEVFAILRADLQYLDDLDAKKIHDSITQQKVDLITPSWQKWGGLNDRFAFLSPRAIEPVLNRRNLVLDYAQQYGNINPEGLLLLVANKNNPQLDETSMRAERVRGNGRVNFEPFDI